jgi:VWFA-related protein
MMRRKTLVAAVVATALLAAPSVNGRRNSGGSPPTQAASEAENPIKQNVSLVNVFATVLDKNHEILTNLKQDDFRIFEGSQEQKIALFSKRTGGPITVALLMDTSWSQQSMLGTEQEAASAFLDRMLSDGDEATVMSFDSDVTLLTDFTAEMAVLDRAIHRTAVNTSIENAGTALYDAVYLACHRLRDEAGRKLLVVFTDGDDYGSKVSLEKAVEAAQRTNTAIWIFLVADPRFSSGYGFGSRGEVVAKIMSSETGGRTVEIRNQTRLSNVMDQFSEEMRLQYVLGYYPTNAKHDGTFRKISVKTQMRGTRVLARRGYYASGE